MDAELKHIMKTSQQRLNMGDNRTNATPPLPALSPGPGMLNMLELQRGGDSSSPDARNTKPSGEQSGMTASRPDLIGEADRKTRLLKRSSKDRSCKKYRSDNAAARHNLTLSQKHYISNVKGAEVVQTMTTINIVESLELGETGGPQ